MKKLVLLSACLSGLLLSAVPALAEGTQDAAARASSLSALDRDDRIAVDASYAKRRGAGSEGHTRSLSASYSKKLDDRQTVFVFVSGSTQDLDAGLGRVSDTDGYNGGAGYSYYMGRGRSVTAAVFGGKDNAESVSAFGPSDVDTSGLGFSVGISQVVPVSTDSAVAGSLTGSFYRSETEVPFSSDDIQQSYRLTPELSYNRKFNADWAGRVFAAAVFSDEISTISDAHNRYDLGGGLKYSVTDDVSLNTRYVHEFGDDHHGDKLTLGFAVTF